MKLSRRITTIDLFVFVTWIFNVYPVHNASNTSSDGSPFTFPNEHNVLVQFLTTAAWKSVLMITDKVEPNIFRQLSDASISYQSLLPFSKRNTSLFVTHSLDSQRCHVVVYCTIRCQEQVISLGKDIFPKRASWLFVCESLENLDSFLNLIRLQQLIRIDSEVFAMGHVSRDKSLVFRISLSLEAHLKSSKLFPIASYAQNIWSLHRERRHHHPLQARVLKFGILHQPPTATIQVKGTTIEYGGLFVELVRLLSKYLGFSYEFVNNTSGAFGKLTKNGSWTGFMEMLLTKKIDVASMAMALTEERFKAVDFAAFVFEVHIVGIFRKPSIDTAVLDILTYFHPFPRYLWLWLTAMLALVFVCFTFSTTYENRDRHYNYWTVISIVVKMGLTDLPQKRSGRVILIFSMVFVLVVSNAYNSLLTAFLTVRKERTLFNNFDDVIDNPNYKFAVCHGNVQYSALKNAKEGIFKEIWKNIAGDSKSFVVSVEEGIAKIYKERHVFISSQLILEHIAATNCSLSVIKEKYFKMTAHMSFPKNSQYLDVFSQKLLAMRSSGILQKEVRKYYAKPNPLDCSSGSTITSVRILDAAGAPVCFLTGLLAAMCCFALEIIIDKLTAVKHTVKQRLVEKL